MSRFRTPGVTAGPTLLLAVGLAVATSATAVSAPAAGVDPATGPDYEMPFLCGEAWTGTSRSYHSPSFYSIDWNRPDDYGHPLLAAAPGVVTRVVPDGSTGYGRYAIIDHGAGRSTLYAHMKQTWLVEGMTIDQSQPVGFLGDTGNVTGPHLHFEERLNGTDVPAYFHRTTFRMNTTQTSTSCPDTPVSGDWNGDGRTDLGVFHRTATGSVFRRLVGTTTTTVAFGTGWDRVFTGDWNGDGTAEVGVRPPGSTVFVKRRTNGTLTKKSYGSVVALPLAGDWDGNGTAQIGVWRPDLHRFALRGGDGVTTYRIFGSDGDLPLAGDWNGDGKDDLGVYRPSTRSFLMRRIAANGTASTTTVALGVAGDLPVIGDWNGDQIDDLGVWSPTKAVFTLRYVARGTTVATTKTVAYGAKRG